MSNPYTTPNADVSESLPRFRVPWLWTIYNSFILYTILIFVIYLSSGKTREYFTATIKSDPSITDAESFDDAMLGLYVINYFIFFVLAITGYLLVWRVNHRDTWALFALTVLSLLWIALGAYSYIFSLGLPDYHISMLDHVVIVIDTLFLMAILVRPYIGWR